MAGEIYLKQNNIGPRMGEIAAFATTTTSAATDLATELGAIATAGDGLCLICDQDLYFFFGTAGGTVDEAAVAGNNRSALWPAKLPYHFRLPGGDAGSPTVLTHKAAATGTIRIWRATDNQ